MASEPETRDSAQRISDLEESLVVEHNNRICGNWKTSYLLWCVDWYIRTQELLIEVLTKQRICASAKPFVWAAGRLGRKCGQ